MVILSNSASHSPYPMEWSNGTTQKNVHVMFKNLDTILKGFLNPFHLLNAN